MRDRLGQGQGIHRGDPLGEAEVEQLGPAHRSVAPRGRLGLTRMDQHDVAGLQVAVHDALGVHGGEPVGDLPHDPERRQKVHRPRRRSARLSGWPSRSSMTSQSLSSASIQSWTSTTDGWRTRARARASRRKRSRACSGCCAPALIRFERHRTIEAIVVAAVHLTHAAFAQAGLDAVGADRLGQPIGRWGWRLHRPVSLERPGSRTSAPRPSALTRRRKP